MILRKSMSLLGIGSARIDLILPKEAYHPAESINGYFLINGGIIEQKIKRIDCDLVMVDHTKGNEKVIDTATFLRSKQILSEELNEIPFVFNLPATIQASSASISYHFKTKLTFSEGIESIDQDNIKII
ncbi:sporulation protein [Heyndrickxia sporothermodurans]